MHVIQPMPLGLSTRPIEYRRRFGLCVSAFLHVPFEQGERGCLWGHQSMWKFAAAEMAQPLLDEGVAKTRPEFLLHGHAFPPDGPDGACAVRVRLGAVEKEIHVFGDRYWEDGRPSQPQPFDRMPLGWERAYGGTDFEQNPRGRGRAAVDGLHWLPNLELPSARLRRPDQAVAPAGFGPLELTHPQRVALRGTYDADYLKEAAPGFAADLDWAYFNLAPRDQWFDAPLRGDEDFALDHLHPQRSHIAGRLPGLRARVFARHRQPLREGEGAGGEGKLRELPLRLTTVWFFPHAERMVLIFHGMAECAEDDGSDIEMLLGAVERIAEPRPDAHYLDVLARRNDPVDGSVESLNDADLLPEGIDVTDPDFEKAREVFAIEGLQAQAQQRRAEVEVMQMREQVKAQGKDPDALGVRMPEPEPVPTMAELPAYLRAKRKEAEAMEWQAVDEAVSQLLKIVTLAKQQKIDLSDLVHRGPPKQDTTTQLKALAAKAQAAGQPVDPALAPKLAQVEAVERLNYLQAAHEQPPAYPLRGEDAARSRAEIVWLLEQGWRTFTGMDLTGADCSGLDLRGADFSGAWLESANFSGSNVSGANFTAAVLAHANLSRLIALECDFTGANLGRARLEGAVFDRSTFAGTMLMYCDFSHTEMRQARLGGANLLESQWGPADWSGAQAPQMLFHRFDLRGVTLAEAALEAATFLECRLEGADLRGADLRHATFMNCRMAGARLAGARLESAVFAEQCDLRGADLSGAVLRSANLGKGDWRGARLTKAVLDQAVAVGADLSDSDLRLASAKGALLSRARFQRSRLAGVNFKEALLAHADLRSADLRHSNFYGADLARIKLDGSTRMEDALFTRARTWPRLSPEQQAALPPLTPPPGAAAQGAPS